METRIYTKPILVIPGRRLTELPADIHLYTNLQKLDCNCNNLTHLDNLPQSLIELWCHNNKITKLNNLPQSLKELSCYFGNPLEYDFKPTLENIRSYVASVR